VDNARSATVVENRRRVLTGSPDPSERLQEVIMSSVNPVGPQPGEDFDDAPIDDELLITDSDELVDDDFAGDDEFVDDADKLDDSRFEVARGDGPVLDD
jgi:hypothetical protein